MFPIGWKKGVRTSVCVHKQTSPERMRVLALKQQVFLKDKKPEEKSHKDICLFE